MNKHFIFLFYLFVTSILFSLQATAVPAYPNKTIVSTYNGKTVGIYMRGDENLKYAVTEDGYTLVSDSSGWWYAMVLNDGIVGKSSFPLTSEEDETEMLRRFKSECPKGIRPERVVQTETYKTQKLRYVKSTEPIVGERRALVILMQFKDFAFRKTREDFESLFNETNYHVDGAAGSVRDYYQFASQQQLDYISDIYGPYTAKNTMSYYGGNTMVGGNDAHAVDLCIEAIKSLPSDIDFSLYDNDNDGLIDNVHIIFAGYGEEAGGPSNAIWSHEYPHRVILTNEIGYSLAGYSCSPELRGNRGSNISYIGVICHELGHALGAMDYYDTNYGSGGEYDGTGQWDIMASGSWNDNGRTPSNFNPYIRSTIFRWNTQEVLTAGQHVVMPRMAANKAELTKVYRIETGSDGDYFLLENRQKDGFDNALPGAGLMIYHVHPYIDKYRSTNTINATHPQGLYPVCASYSEPEKKKYGNINSAECPFPGSSKTRDFTATSTPAAVAWNGNSAKIFLQNIRQNTDNGEIMFSTDVDSANDPDDPETPLEGVVIYREDFESGLKDHISVSSILGNSQWQTYKKGNYILGANDIPNPSEGERILMIYTHKANVISESDATSPYIAIEAGKGYVLSFDIHTAMESNQVVPKFNLYVEDEYGEYDVFSLEEVTNKWLQVEIPLVFAGSKFRYQLHGRIMTGGIFIDNIRLITEDSPNYITSTISTEYNGHAMVFNLDGTCLGTFRLWKTKKQKGIYIIREGTKGRKVIVP